MDLRVCFLGDSYVAGVGDETALGWVGRVVGRARAGGLDLTGYNLGVRRETSLDVGRRFLPELRPRLTDGAGYGVVLAVGVNDTTVENGARRVEQQATLHAVESMTKAAVAAGWGLLVVGPALVADEQQNVRLVELSGAMNGCCDANAVPYVEVAGSLRGDPDWLTEVAGVDGAHPSARGYERLSAVIWPHFSHWLGGLGGR